MSVETVSLDAAEITSGDADGVRLAERANGVATPSEPRHRSVGLALQWDAPLTYDVLTPDAAEDRAGDRGPFFVGRQHLLGPLVNAISDPTRGGTYLISGYRGTGKSSLVTEAARRASPELKKRGFTLLPLVLNVSEISASLESASGKKAPPLGIDARRLLTALLRALHKRFPVNERKAEHVTPLLRALRKRSPGDEPKPDRSDLARLIAKTFRKSEAARYTETAREVAEATAQSVVETRTSFVLKDVLRVLAVFAVLGIVALEGFALATSSAAIQIACAALAGVAVISFTTSRTLVKTHAERQHDSEEFVFDNSLHLVESDLKQILDQLLKEKFRTMFVLEELDKVKDDRGEQLDAVIRYFKNLFTQAPALFFFLTDKDYFDVIDKKITDSRRLRTYAVEHTFFTNRLFVTRPSLDECLDYFLKVLRDDDARAAVAEIRKTAGTRVRTVDEMTGDEPFLRVLLFRCQNHLFDLKNEMRGYVIVEGEASSLSYDELILPPQERALAAFHFLLEQKATLYRFGGGRDYANEVLRDCLSSIFDDIGSDLPQTVSDIVNNQDERGAQLRLAERQRIAEALDALLADLNRGGAIDIDASSPTAPTARTFRWRPNALLVFSPVAKLESHELSLKEQLERAIRVCGLFTEGGVLHGVAAPPTDLDLDKLKADFAAQVNIVEQAGQPLAAEDAAQQSAQIVRQLAPLVNEAHAAHLKRLDARGWQISTIGEDRRINTVTRPADSGGPPRALLVYGVELGLQPLVQSTLESMRPGPVAVVLVDDDPHSAPELRNEGRRTTLEAWRSVVAVDDSLKVAVTQIALDEDLIVAAAENSWGPSIAENVQILWGMATSDEFDLARLWAAQAVSADIPQPVPTPPGVVPGGPAWLGSSEGTERRYESLSAAIGAWLAQGDPLLLAPSLAGVTEDQLWRAFFDAATTLDVLQVLSDPLGTGPVTPLEPDTQLRLGQSGRLVQLDRGGPSVQAAPSARLVLAGSFSAGDFAFRGLQGRKLSTIRTLDLSSALDVLASTVAVHSSEQATQLYQAAGRLGDLQAMTALVGRYLAAGDSNSAEEWASALIDRRDWTAVKEAASLALPVSRPLAERLWTKAADDGDMDAIASLAAYSSDASSRERWEQQLLGTGSGDDIRKAAQLVTEDADRSLRLYKAAADKGDPYAMLEAVVRAASADPDASRMNEQRLRERGDGALLKEAVRRLQAVDPQRAEELQKQLVEAPPGNQ